jgi:hypothetical protein
MRRADKPVYIYALRVEDQETYFYVGATYWPEIRLRGHIRRALKGRHENKRLEEIIQAAGKDKICMDIIEETFGVLASQAELRWIRYYGSNGHSLTNKEITRHKATPGVSVLITEELHTTVKLAAIERGVSMRQYLDEAIRRGMESREERR